MTSIVLIGSGNVAESLAAAITGSPCKLAQVYARNGEKGKRMAERYGCPFTDDPARLAQADIYLIAVSDKAVAEVSASLRFGNAIVAHTAGCVAIDELSPEIHRRGVFYPLQTFTAGRPVPMQGVPVFIEGSDRVTTDALKELAHVFGAAVHEASSEQRKMLHLCGVFACNFTNHMYAVGQRLLQTCGLEPGLLDPLIRETADKVLAGSSAASVQTGPARRGDTKTQGRHLDLLRNEPELQNLYEQISLNIWETSKKI